MKYLVFILLFISFSVLGESAEKSAEQNAEQSAEKSAEQCVRMEHTDQRLACFDRLFPATTETESQKQTNNKEEMSSTTANEEDLGATEVGKQEAAANKERVEALPSNHRTDKNSSSEDAKDFSFGKLFGKGKKLHVISKIQDLRSGNAQKMVFLLDNNEIWLQNSPRNLPFHKGDEVTIKSGLLGGYIMRSDGGTATRVRRIR